MGIRVANFQAELKEHGIPCLLDLPAVGRLAFFCLTCKSGGFCGAIVKSSLRFCVFFDRGMMMILSHQLFIYRL